MALQIYANIIRKKFIDYIIFKKYYNRIKNYNRIYIRIYILNIYLRSIKFIQFSAKT
jgi:hypothetical protein